MQLGAVPWAEPDYVGLVVLIDLNRFVNDVIKILINILLFLLNLLWFTFV